MDKDKAQKVIAKFIAQTLTGKLKWRHLEDIEGLQTGSIAKVLQAFTAEYEDNRFVVYNYEYRDSDEHENQFWDTEVAISVVDGKFAEKLPFPRVPNRWALFSTVRDNVFGANALLDSILKNN